MTAKKLFHGILLFFVVLNLCGFNYQNYAQVNSEKYPDANTVLLYNYDQISYAKDGSNVNIDDYYLKVLLT